MEVKFEDKAKPKYVSWTDVPEGKVGVHRTSGKGYLKFKGGSFLDLHTGNVNPAITCTLTSPDYEVRDVTVVVHAPK